MALQKLQTTMRKRLNALVRWKLPHQPLSGKGVTNDALKRLLTTFGGLTDAELGSYLDNPDMAIPTTAEPGASWRTLQTAGISQEVFDARLSQRIFWRQRAVRNVPLLTGVPDIDDLVLTHLIVYITNESSWTYTLLRRAVLEMISDMLPLHRSTAIYHASVDTLLGYRTPLIPEIREYRDTLANHGGVLGIIYSTAHGIADGITPKGLIPTDNVFLSIFTYEREVEHSPPIYTLCQATVDAIVNSMLSCAQQNGVTLKQIVSRFSTDAGTSIDRYFRFMGYKWIYRSVNALLSNEIMADIVDLKWIRSNCMFAINACSGGQRAEDRSVPNMKETIILAQTFFAQRNPPEPFLLDVGKPDLYLKQFISYAIFADDDGLLEYLIITVPRIVTRIPRLWRVAMNKITYVPTKVEQMMRENGIIPRH